LPPTRYFGEGMCDLTRPSGPPSGRDGLTRAATVEAPHETVNQ
jgi:hypothetical protein